MTPTQRALFFSVAPTPPVTVLRYDPTSDANLTLSGASVQGAVDMSGNGRNASASGVAGPDRVTGASGINNVQCFDFVGANNDSLTVTNALNAFNGVSRIAVMAVLEIPAFTLPNILFNVFSSVSGNRLSASLAQTTGYLQVSTKRRNSDTALTTASTICPTAGTRAFVALSVDYLRGEFTFQVDDAIQIIRPAAIWSSGRGRTENVNSSAAPLFGRAGSSIITGKIGGFRVDTGAISQDAITAQRMEWRSVFDTGLKKLAFIEPTVGLNKVFQYV